MITLLNASLAFLAAPFMPGYLLYLLMQKDAAATLQEIILKGKMCEKLPTHPCVKSPTSHDSKKRNRMGQYKIIYILKSFSASAH